MSHTNVHRAATVGLGLIGGIVFFLLVVAGLLPEYSRCGLICVREWTINTPQLWFPLLGAIGAIIKMIYDVSKRKAPTSMWAFCANALIGSYSGFLSFFLTQWISGDPGLSPRNLPFSYIFAVVAGYLGEMFYARLVEKAWTNNDDFGGPTGGNAAPS